MKKGSLMALVLGLVAVMTTTTGRAQNMDCLGLKNPTNFTLTGGNAQSVWTGFIGTKQSQVSTCTTLGATFSTTVTASNLTSMTSSCSSIPSSVDINGSSDGTQRFSIKGSGTDPGTNNNLSYLPPDTTFTSSIRLGNYCIGAEAEMLTYEFNVNSNNSLVTIWYAMSLENALHGASQNPEFIITVEKQSGSNWALAGGDTLCYIKQSPVSGAPVAPFIAAGGSYNNLYLNWNKVIINLSNLLYQRVRIKIATCDCSASGHYGCCYFAGECQPMKLAANGCAAGETDQVAQIDAPKGANAYAWYRSKTGVLSGAARNDTNNYFRIPNESEDNLNVVLDHFIVQGGDTVTQSTFMCKMTTRMNETYPIVSPIFTDVGNTKPRLIVDSTLFCDASITLRDVSVTPYTLVETDRVDTMHTQWTFYSSPEPTPLTALETTVGPSAHHQYATAGNYSARVRTTAYDTSCWNEKTVHFRTLQAPTPRIRIERDSLCRGDAIALFDETLGSQYHEWTFHFPQGDSVIVAPTPVVQMTFDTTTRVTLRTRTGTYYLDDTNHDGVMDHVHCYATLDVTIHVEDYPELVVTGDTIVCYGTQAIIHVASQVPNTTYDWFTSMESNNPLQSATETLTTSPTHDTRYYVRATSTFGCRSWDSINIYIVDPTLSVPVTAVCDGTPVMLYAANAYSYTWTAMPDDPSLAGQSTNETIEVTPHQTTTYTLVGHGMNECSTLPLTQTVTVYPYPIPEIEMSPKFIDSEKPTVTFRDVSEGATTSLWNFGNGNTSTERQIRYTFTDLTQDSVEISLTTGNELNCTSDTSFWVPIELFAVWFPNAFTPDESTNRVFRALTHNNLEFYTLYIYDRNGNLVFYSYNQEDEWDGTYKERKCPQGVYVYTCTYRRPGTSDIVTDRGTVTLLR